MEPQKNHRDRVRSEIEAHGPLEAFGRLISESDALIRGPILDNGRQIADARCAIYEGLMAHWAEEEHRKSGYDRPFAVVALGGTGRAEMTPCSDTDFAYLFDDILEGNPFLIGLQNQVIHGSSDFKKRFGFKTEVFPFNLESMPELDEKQLNAFLDLRPVYDPHGLADVFRDRIRETYEPFEHFLHATRLWRENWGKEVGALEQLDRFDIKNEGLRIFLAGIWAMAGERYCHSHDIYAELDDPRDLQAYDFLLRIRSFIHLRKGTRKPPSMTGSHVEDVLGFDDFLGFGDLLGSESGEREKFEFANDVRGKLLDARRRVDRFTWGVIGRALKKGRFISSKSAIVYGSGGLRDTANHRITPREKSQAALTILLSAQCHQLPIDPSEMESTFRDAGDWLEPVPELWHLFRESRGSLADSLQFLSQLPGACERLFPGYDKFESSLDGRVMAERESLRGVHMRRKIRALEERLERGREKNGRASSSSPLKDDSFAISVSRETARLEAHILAGVKLALATKRLPETARDLDARNDASKPLHERFSSGLSGIPLDEYYTRCFSGCDFREETLEVARFLVENRRAFVEHADGDLMVENRAEEILRLCKGNEDYIRALFVFTYMDRIEWKSEKDDPTRWFNIRELYAKALLRYRPKKGSTGIPDGWGFSPEEEAILNDLGEDFFNGIYGQEALKFGMPLLRLKEDPEAPPKVGRIYIGRSKIIAVACRDHRGIAASISGAFWKHGVGLRQAHLFSAANHGLALDFFHLDIPGGDGPDDSGLDNAIENAIVGKLYIAPEDEENLPAIAQNITIHKSISGLFLLRAETGDADRVGAMVYELAYKAYRHLGANIHGLAAHRGKGHAWVNVHLSLPKRLSLEDAGKIVGGWA